MTRPIILTLLLATAANAQPLSVSLGGWGTGPSLSLSNPPPFYNLYRISDATTLQPVVEWSVPNVQPSPNPQSWSLNASTAASYGVDWSVVEHAILNPAGYLFIGIPLQPNSHPGHPWERQNDPNVPVFTTIHELRYVVDPYISSQFFSVLRTGWSAIGEGTITPAPGDFNEDGVVNAADYTWLRDKFGFYEPWDGWIDEGTLNAFWRKNFGLVSAQPAGNVAVPEPGAWWMLLGLLPILRRRERKD